MHRWLNQRIQIDMAKSLRPQLETTDLLSLTEINERFDSCRRCASERNPLRHVFGGGATEKPQYCFVLINPTYRNLSADPAYEGPRFPFIGVRAFWRVLNRGGFLSDDILRIVDRRPWTQETTRAVLAELKRQSIYLTNLVKCAQPHANVPGREVFREDMPLFTREMVVVDPARIVAFGQLTVRVLTGLNLRLGDYYKSVRSNGLGWGLHFSAGVSHTIPVFPNFFPIGRGQPRLSAEILGLIKKASLRTLGQDRLKRQEVTPAPHHAQDECQAEKSSANLALISKATSRATSSSGRSPPTTTYRRL